MDSIIWDRLIRCKDEIIEIFEDNGTEIDEPGMAHFNQPDGSWINRVWANDHIRRAHIDVVDARDTKGEVVEGTVQFYGMSSNAAMAKHGSRKDGYRGAEGKVVKIPYKGAVEHTLTEILGGVRSAATYIGAKRIKDMPKCTTFVRCTQNVNPVFNQYNV